MLFSGGLTIKLQFDAIGTVFAALETVLFVLCAVYARSYLNRDARVKRFYLFLAMTYLSLLGLSAANNLFTFYLFFELLSVFSFPLVLHTGTNEARGAAVKYFAFSVFGATLALTGMLMLRNASVGAFADGGFVAEKTKLRMIAALLLVVGFSCKAGLMPLSNWLPTAHPEAPAPASALLSGAITKAGMLGAIRVLYNVFDPYLINGTWVQRVLLVLSLVTVFVGSMLAYREKTLKKRLAFSSVSQLSYVLFGLVLLNSESFSGAMLQIVFHAAAKVGLFLAAGAIIHKTGKTRVDELVGIGKAMPVTLTCFAACALSLVGIPPFGGFAAKWKLMEGATLFGAALGRVGVAVLLVSALLTAGYLLPVVGNAFFAGEGAERNEADARMLVPMMLLAAFVLIMGMFPGVFARLFDTIGIGFLGGVG